MMLRSPVFSPKFSRRSAKNLVETAARVVEQLNAAGSEISDGGDDVAGEATKEEVEAEEEFEFPTETAFPPISADEIFYNGQILPVFPVHERNLLTAEAIFPEWRSNFFAVSKYGGKKAPAPASAPAPAPARLPLRKLLGEIREAPSSDSSSESDDLDGCVHAAGTYCVWLPKPGGRCKLSCSTGGSTKRWKLRDLLRRSNSEGKDAIVFLTSSLKKLMDKKLKKSAAIEAPSSPAGK